MFKKFLMKKMLQSQLKNVPPEQRDQIMQAVSNNPELFQKIEKEIKAAVKSGKPKMAASMEVMRKYQGELQKAMRR